MKLKCFYRYFSIDVPMVLPIVLPPIIPMNITDEYYCDFTVNSVSFAVDFTKHLNVVLTKNCRLFRKFYGKICGFQWRKMRFFSGF